MNRFTGNVHNISVRFTTWKCGKINARKHMTHASVLAPAPVPSWSGSYKYHLFYSVIVVFVVISTCGQPTHRRQQATTVKGQNSTWKMNPGYILIGFSVFRPGKYTFSIWYVFSDMWKRYISMKKLYTNANIRYKKNCFRLMYKKRDFFVNATSNRSKKLFSLVSDHWSR